MGVFWNKHGKSVNNCVFFGVSSKNYPHSSPVVIPRGHVTNHHFFPFYSKLFKLNEISCRSFFFISIFLFRFRWKRGLHRSRSLLEAGKKFNSESPQCDHQTTTKHNLSTRRKMSTIQGSQHSENKVDADEYKYDYKKG